MVRGLLCFLETSAIKIFLFKNQITEIQNSSSISNYNIRQNMNYYDIIVLSKRIDLYREKNSALSGKFVIRSMTYFKL